MKSPLDQKIIQRIKEGQISPKPRSFFVLKNISFWASTIVSIVVGAVAFATILYDISGKSYIVESIFSNNALSLQALTLIPYFWIVILSTFLYLSVRNYKKTDNFYKYNIYFIFLIIITFSISIGAFLFSAGVGQATDELSKKYIPFYDRYSKILDIKKDIFIDKMQELGITKELLDNNPELREQVDKKFRENVLGKRYVADSPEQCSRIKFACESSEIHFSDDKGCGCRDLYQEIN